MERYSRLCELLRNGQPSRELGCSKNLGTFLRQLGIMDLQAAYGVVEEMLSDSRYQASADHSMVVRYCPVALAERPGWARDVVPFLALCATGPDSRGGLRQHTYFFQPAPLLKAGEFDYLSYLFGTRFALSAPADDAALHSLDYEQSPARIAPAYLEEDALLVKLAAAALLKKRPIVLKLEKDRPFNARAMELLCQIYALLPPALAVQTGFSVFQDPRQLEHLIRTTPIRIFLLHPDAGCSATDQQYLYFDLNQSLNLQLAPQQAKDFQVSKQLFTCLTYWHGLPWRERQPLMELLFSTEKTLPNEQSYSNITRSFIREPFIQWINRMPDRGTIASLEELKEKYDSFPICERVPVLREKFCAAVPELLKPPLTLQSLTADAHRRSAEAEGEERDALKALALFGQMLLSIRPADPEPTAPPQKEAPAPQTAAPVRTEDPKLQQDLRELEKKLSALTAENKSLRTDREEMERSFSHQYQKLRQENDALRTENKQKLEEVERSFSQQYQELRQENQTLLDSMAREHEAALAALNQEHAEAIARHRKAQVEVFDQLMAARKEHSAARNAVAELEQALQEALESPAAGSEELDLLRSAAEAAEANALLLQRKLDQQERIRNEALDQERLKLERSMAEAIADLEQKHAEALALKNYESQQFEQALLDQIEELSREKDNQAAKLKAEFAAREQLEDAHVADLARILREHDEQLKSLRNAAESAEVRALNLETMLSQAERTRQDILDQERRKLERSMAEAIADLEQKHAEALARQKNDAEETELTLLAQLQESSEEKDALAAKLKAEFTAAREKLEDEHVADLARIRREHDEQLNALRSGAEAAESKARALENDLRTSKNALEAEKQKHAQTEASMKQKYVDAFNELRSEATSRIQQLQQELETARSAGPVSSDEFNDAADRIRQLRDDLALRESRIIDLQKKLDSQEQKLRDTVAQINSTNAESRKALEQEHKEQITRINEINNKTRRELEQQHKDQITRINETNAQLRQQLEQQHRDEIARINETNRKLRQESKQPAADSEAELRKQLDQLRKEVIQVTNQRLESEQSLNRRILELKEELEEARKQASPGGSPKKWPFWG